MFPEVGQRRRLKFADGSTKLIRIESVYPASEGPKAFWVTDSRGDQWLFSLPSPWPPISSPEVSISEGAVL
jgi:hypothetical protein